MFIGGPGTDKTRLATAIAVSGIALQGKRVRFYSTVDLVSVLAREKHDGKAGRIARSLMRMDLVGAVLQDLPTRSCKSQRRGRDGTPEHTAGGWPGGGGVGLAGFGLGRPMRA